MRRGKTVPSSVRRYTAGHVLERTHFQGLRSQRATWTYARHALRMRSAAILIAKPGLSRASSGRSLFVRHETTACRVGFELCAVFIFLSRHVKPVENLSLVSHHLGVGSTMEQSVIFNRYRDKSRLSFKSFEGGSFAAALKRQKLHLGNACACVPVRAQPQREEQPSLACTTIPPRASEKTAESSGFGTASFTLEGKQISWPTSGNRQYKLVSDRLVNE